MQLDSESVAELSDRSPLPTNSRRHDEYEGFVMRAVIGLFRALIGIGADHVALRRSASIAPKFYHFARQYMNGGMRN